MKPSQKILFLSILLTLLLFSQARADHRINVIQTQINKIVHETVINELKLKGDKKATVLKILQKNDYKRVKIMDQLWHVREQLQKKDKHSSTSDLELATLIQKIKKIRKDIEGLENKNERELKNILTKEELAKYIVLKHKLSTKLKKAVREELKKK